MCVCGFFFFFYRSHVKQIGNICAISSVNLKSFKQQLNFIVMHSKTHIESINISYNRQNIRQYAKTTCIKSQRQINNSSEHHLPGLNSDQNLPLLCRGLGLLLTPDHFGAPKSRQHHALDLPRRRGSSLGALLLLLCWHVFADAWETWMSKEDWIPFSRCCDRSKPRTEA